MSIPRGRVLLSTALTIASLPGLGSHVRAGGVSSHSPQGTNFDLVVNPVDLGPGQRNYLYRDSQGRYVLLDVQGPGAITRIWFTMSSATENSSVGNIQIYFDDSPTPAVDMPAADFFAGRSAAFPKPLCGDFRVSSGGNYCDVRMPFARRAKLMVTGTPSTLNFYYDIGYETYDPGTPVRTFDATTAPRASYPARLAGARLVRGRATIPPGGTVPMADLRGPGTIASLQITAPRTDGALHGTWLDARWDGAARPAVSAPLADLFLTGAGVRKPALGALAGYRPATGQGYLYFPMPFARRGVLRLRNRSPQPVPVRWRITLARRRYPHVGTATGRLHATFAQDRSTALGRDFTMLDTGVAGKIVGFGLTEAGSPAGSTFFMEGDERVHFDGSRSPRFYGTGTEDIFDGAYYYATGPFTTPSHGATAKEQSGPDTMLTSQYRLLLSDPWPFEGGVHFGIEHGGGDGIATMARGIVFWYAGVAPALRRTDTVDVGDAASERAAGYTGAGTATGMTAYFEGDHDGNLSSRALDNIFPGSLPSPLAPLITTDEAVVDAGRLHPPGSMIGFRVGIDPANDGVLLRRTYDQAVFDQRAEVLVDGDPVGIWQNAGSNSSKRFADSDFALPASLTKGRDSLVIGLRVLAPDETLNELGGHTDTGWSDYRYDAYVRAGG